MISKERSTDTIMTKTMNLSEMISISVGGGMTGRRGRIASTHPYEKILVAFQCDMTAAVSPTTKAVQSNIM